LANILRNLAGTVVDIYLVGVGVIAPICFVISGAPAQMTETLVSIDPTISIVVIIIIDIGIITGTSLFLVKISSISSIIIIVIIIIVIVILSGLIFCF
jgi:hypothetical protein